MTIFFLKTSIPHFLELCDYDVIIVIRYCFRVLLSSECKVMLCCVDYCVEIVLFYKKLSDNTKCFDKPMF